jgi:hypothetical protein
MENNKLYSTTIPKLFYVFGCATIIGAIADWLLLSTTLQDLDIGSAVAALFPALLENDPKKYIVLQDPQVLPAILTCFILGFCICLLGVVFMFKAGSSSVENKTKKIWKIHTEYFLILIWFALGLGLAFLRYFSDPNNNSNYLLAILLFVLYLGTGVTSYLLGQMLGNPYLSKYRKLTKELESKHRLDLQGCYEDLVEANANCRQIQLEIDCKLREYLVYYNQIDEILDAEYSKANNNNQLQNTIQI